MLLISLCDSPYPILSCSIVFDPILFHSIEFYPVLSYSILVNPIFLCRSVSLSLFSLSFECFVYICICSQILFNNLPPLLCLHLCFSQTCFFSHDIVHCFEVWRRARGSSYLSRYINNNI